MRSAMIRKLLAAVTIAAVIAGGFVFTHSYTCYGRAELSPVGMCTAEAMSAPTLWIAGVSRMATQSKRVWKATATQVFAFAAPIFITTLILLSLALPNAPVPNHKFIPHLSASHGW